jgi:hypothetical protein
VLPFGEQVIVNADTRCRRVHLTIAEGL